MARARHSARSGLTVLEFTLTVLLISVLIVFVAKRVIALRVELERAAVEHTVSTMRSALSLRFAELVTHGKIDQVHTWAGQNALKLIKGRSAVPTSEPEELGPGTWSYEGDRGEIVYRPAYPEALTGDPDAVGRWRVEVSGDGQPTGLRLKTIASLHTGARARAEE